jgi:hypothetical protein
MNAQRALFRLILTIWLFYIIAASIMLTIENNFMITIIRERMEENKKMDREESKDELYA